MYLVTPIGGDCQPPPTFSDRGGHGQGLRHVLGPLNMRIHHLPSHCIKDCFPNGPAYYCSCCDHSLPMIQEHTLSHLIHAVLIKGGMIDAYPDTTSQP
jgi:hypothetical protein